MTSLQLQGGVVSGITILGDQKLVKLSGLKELIKARVDGMLKRFNDSRRWQRGRLKLEDMEAQVSMRGGELLVEIYFKDQSLSTMRTHVYLNPHTLKVLRTDVN